MARKIKPFIVRMKGDKSGSTLAIINATTKQDAKDAYAGKWPICTDNLIAKAWKAL